MKEWVAGAESSKPRKASKTGASLRSAPPSGPVLPYLPGFLLLCILGRCFIPLRQLLSAEGIPEAGLTEKDICHTVSAPV